MFDGQYVLYLQNSIFISQQYIVLQSNLVDPLKIMFDAQYVLLYLQTVHFFSQQWVTAKIRLNCLTRFRPV